MISPTATGLGTTAGSALLALWIVVRYRGLGPQTIVSSLFACGISLALLRGIGPAMKWAVDTVNPAVALLLVAVPLLSCAFWSGGALVRALLDGWTTPLRP